MSPGSIPAAEEVQKLARVETYLGSDPRNLDLLAMAIDLSLASDDPARARRHAEAALEHYPDDVFFLARMGAVLMAQHDWQAAASFLERALRRHRDVELAYKLSYCYTWLGRHREAFDTLVGYGAEMALPAHVVTLLVRALHHMGELDQATVLIEAELPRCQEHAAFLGAASMVYLDNGNIEESARLSELALAGGARPVEALVVAASLALGRIDADAAIRICNEVLADNPGEGRSWSGLGLASMLKRDLPAAERQLEQAVKFMPGHPGTLHALGWCKILSSDLRGARAIFLKALELDRNFGDSHGGLAVVQALDGERQAAEESIKRALGLDPNSLSAKFARMALDGKVSDPARFRALVPRLLAGYRAPFGQSLDAMLDEYEER